MVFVPHIVDPCLFIFFKHLVNPKTLRNCCFEDKSNKQNVNTIIYEYKYLVVINKYHMNKKRKKIRKVGVG